MKSKELEEFMKTTRITIDPNMVTHENDPFFIRQAEESKRMLDNCKPSKEFLEALKRHSNKEIIDETTK